MLRPDRKEELFANIKRNAVYVDKEDVLETPGREFHEVEFDLPEVLKRQYMSLKNELYIEVCNTTITAPSAAAKLNKLNQVTSGFIIDTQAIKENRVFEEKLQEWYLLDRYPV